jgi:hypothetical protein
MSRSYCSTMHRVTHLVDLTFVEPPRRSQLLEGLRARLPEVAPALRLIAEGVLGADSSIDFVGVEPTGRVVLIFIGEEGDDLELVGRAVAQRAWVEPRIRDWIQLAPNLGVRPGAGTRAVLLCPSFRHETEVAAAALGDQAVSLLRYRCLRNGGNLEILTEPVAREIARGSTPPGSDRSGVPAFRTGLSHEDLGLTAEEHLEFD